MDKYIGKRLDGRYEIRELVGVGGMANVYKAFDLVENRWVAVKVLRDEYMSNEEFLRRFRNESKAVATLSHPNIVKVFDVSFSQKMHSIVMEYIDGISLKEFIDQQGCLSWKETLHFTVQILRALQHAHDNGIVHRDIKPQNIMLLSDGTIKVTDFGIARFARSNTKTITDRAIGSVHYISPEQAQGGAIDEKTDIYSVGVMMYEMLTGRLPFDAESPVSVALKQIQLEPTRPGAINPDIPEGLEAITMRAMQKDPARRYQSAAEMLRDIDEFKRDPSVRFAYKYLGTAQAGIAQNAAVRAHAQTGAPQSGRTGDSEHTDRTRAAQTRISEPPTGQEPPDGGDDEDEAKPRVPFLSVLTGITVAFVLVSVAFIGVMFYLNNPFATVDSVDVPELVGTQFQSAKYDSALSQHNIKVIVDETKFNNSYAKGEIFEQDPRSGRTMKVGGTIKVKVSAGEQSITLKDLAGLESNEAAAELERSGLTSYSEIKMYDDNVSEGYIIKTDPAPNTTVDSDTEIKLYVSMGRENKLLNVPSIKGMTVDDANRLLRNFNLTIGKVNQVKNEDVEPGVIVAQYPDTDSQVPQGSSIDVDISEGEFDMIKRRITITLPPLKKLVTVEALLDDKAAAQASLTPGQGDASNLQWTNVYEGYGVQRLVVRIEGMAYQVWEIDFDEGTHRKIEDNAALFANGVPEAPPEDSSSSGDEDAAEPDAASSSSRR